MWMKPTDRQIISRVAPQCLVSPDKVGPFFSDVQPSLLAYQRHYIMPAYQSSLALPVEKGISFSSFSTHPGPCSFLWKTFGFQIHVEIKVHVQFNVTNFQISGFACSLVGHLNKYETNFYRASIKAPQTFQDAQNLRLMNI